MIYRIVMTSLSFALSMIWADRLAAQLWQQQSPYPTEIHLYAVDFVDANTGWIAGAFVDDGEIWRTTDAGGTWVRQYQDEFSYFEDVDMIDATRGWAIGDQIYRTTNGGNSWSTTELPRGVSGVKVEFFSETQGFMSTRPSGLTNHLYRTSNGGATWQYLGDFYVGLWDFADANVGWAVDLNQGFVRTNDGGQTWQSVPTPDPQTIDSQVTKAISWDEAIVRTFKNNAATVHHTTDGGQTWVSAAPESGGRDQFFLDDTFGWGVAFFNLYRTTDGGATWVNLPNWKQSVREVIPLDHDSAIAVGDWGYISRTDDGGATWTQESNGSGKDLIKIGMANTRQGWAVGNDAALLRTDDGGENWRIQIPPSTWHLGNLQVLSPQTAVVHRGSIGDGNLAGYFKTTDGGETWVDISGQWPLGIFRFLDENRGAIISLSGLNFYWTEDGGQSWENRPTTGIDLNPLDVLYDIFMIDENLGWAVGRYRKVFRTVDGGRTWDEWGSPNGPSQIYRHVRFADANRGWIAGNSGTVYYTNNGGQSWQDRSLRTFNQHIQDVHLANGDEFYIVGGYSGHRPGTGWLRRTSDAGQTWPFLFDGRRGIQNGVAVVGEHIWTAGYGGTIHHFGPEVEGAIIGNVTVVNGTLLAGGVNELTSSDNSYLHTRSGFGSTLVDLHNMEMVVTAITGAESPTALDVTIESRIDEPSGQAQIRLHNWTTGNWDLVGTYAVGSSDELHQLSGIAAAEYINGSGVIELSIKHLVFRPFLAFQFESFIDEVRIEVR